MTEAKELSGSSSSDIHELYEYHKQSELNNKNEYGTTQTESAIPLNEYNEPNVTVGEFGKDIFHSPGSKAVHYLISLFPIAKWILHYNISWLYADLVAGVTVGVVMVPQSMSYAQLAGLEAQYGLYSAFVGVFIYCFFATSKDVSIGPVAVMSLEVSKVITRVQEKRPDLEGPVIATILSLVCGAIAIALGLLRLGFILEFISIPAVMGFMSGSAFSIIVGQVPALMGYNKLVNTRKATYLVAINTLKNLPNTKLDAVFGLIPLIILYAWKFICNWGPKKYPKHRLWFFYIQALRNGVVLIVFTLISWGLIRHNIKKTKISILGTVPSGLREVGLMEFPSGVMSSIAPELPAATIVLLLEHISISKSFGRINDYKIVPDQELVAIGATNLIGTFFNAYPATGSFSRSALKAKCNVKTPFAGIYTGACVLLALYALTDAFYFIPKATLSAVIIHAVSDLIANYTATLNFWRIAPLDAGIFIVAVFITVFSSIENGIYFAICASCALLLLNVAFPNGSFMGRVRVAEVINPQIIKSNHTEDEEESVEVQEENIESTKEKKSDGKFDSKNFTKPTLKYHTKWVPFTKTILNKDVQILPPPPGVVVFRPAESWTYLNCSRQYDAIFDEIKRVTRRGIITHDLKDIDRPWNDPGPLILPWNRFKQKRSDLQYVEDSRPVLKVLAFDFSTVNQVDSTAIQALVDLKKAVNKYTDSEVEFHFAGVYSPWIRRGLVNSGFGIASSDDSFTRVSYVDLLQDEESSFGYESALGTNTPFFHLEIPSFDYLDEEVKSVN